MPRQALELRELAEERLGEKGDAPVAVGVARPVVGGEHRADGDRLDGLPLLDQVRVVVVGELRGEVVVLERFRVRHGQQRHARFEFELGERSRRLARDQDGGGDLARFHHLVAVRLADVDLLALDAEEFEDQPRRELRAAADVGEVHLLAGEILQASDAGPGKHVQLLVVELGDVGDTLVAVSYTHLDVYKRQGSARCRRERAAGSCAWRPATGSAPARPRVERKGTRPGQESRHAYKVARESTARTSPHRPSGRCR